MKITLAPPYAIMKETTPMSIALQTLSRKQIIPTHITEDHKYSLPQMAILNSQYKSGLLFKRHKRLVWIVAVFRDGEGF